MLLERRERDEDDLAGLASAEPHRDQGHPSEESDLAVYQQHRLEQAFHEAGKPDRQN
ncbi:hypothetical protein [Mesorhizobium sp. M0220]|uniref:hypothetical protein n=1 Tax=Mesorhizobium sp. M0220 TaxID=2956920 RepID=UPI00333C9E9D